MAQHTEVSLPDIRFTRADFTALRAYLLRIPLARIGALYYPEDDFEALGGEPGLHNRLEILRDRLIASASASNPHLVELLRNARRSGTWSGKLVNFLVRAAETTQAAPQRSDSLGIWFRPRVAAVLREESVKTLGELMALINIRGSGWWKPVRRLGFGKASRIEAWLNRHANTLGSLLPVELPAVLGPIVELSANSMQMVPLERMSLPETLNGSYGTNRATAFCQIAARNDLDAIEAYLYRFRAQEKTRRSYQKELERFLLWCIQTRNTPLSSTTQEDCEAYKDFLGSIPSNWIGPRQPRHSTRWRPFAGQLSPTSQKYAVQALRFFFNWLVDVRYLGGNPWATVADPSVSITCHKLQIEKALSESLWTRLIGPNGILDILCRTPDTLLQTRYSIRGRMAKASLSAQFRLVRAALLLIGDTGLRREEAVTATRDRLRPISDTPGIWELSVLGKRNKWRTVFPSRRAIEALQSHWVDRQQDFSFGLVAQPLFSPLIAPSTPSAQAKHGLESSLRLEAGFTGDGLYTLITTALCRIANDAAFDLDEEERSQLRRTAPHAFRHTFGTHAVAHEVPLDVVQKVLGHVSLQTTTIYVQAEKKRAIQELGKMFAS